jgi:hypothetical protein
MSGENSHDSAAEAPGTSEPATPVTALTALTPLEAAISDIPGVTRLYPAANVVARAASAIGSALPGAPARDDDIVVEEARIVVRIGVDSERPAAAVCRAVYATVRDWAAERRMDGADIEITVAGIE